MHQVGAQLLHRREGDSDERRPLRAQLSRLAVNSLSYGPQLSRLAFERRMEAQRAAELRARAAMLRRVVAQPRREFCIHVPT